MAQKKSLFAELIERRIPQILGMYVAAVWLAVEIGDWMSERFDVPVQFSSYVFVIMISFLPLVGLLAWGHGRPGKDKWTQKQIIFIPFNIILAYFAVTSFIKPAVQATEMLSIVDEQTGQMLEYEVAKTGFNQKVMGFFWENETGDEQFDWLSYGAMWLVSQDLMRNAVISIKTPYDSSSILTEVRNRGYDDAIGEPLSLDLSISDDREAQWMIKGKIIMDGQQLAFQASLYDVVTGTLVTTITSAYDDWLFALDDVAEQIGKVILKQTNIKTQVIPDLPISQHVSDDIEAIQEVIRALNAVEFNNDYVAGVEYLQAALKEDDSLAEAYVLLVDYFRGMGDMPAAKAASEAALKLEHKLYQESVFKVKANYYAVNGEQDKAIKVLENWVKLVPESAEALQALGSNYIVVGNRLDDALKVYQKLNEIQEASSEAMLNQARIYRLKGDLEQTINTLEHYYAAHQDKAEPLLEMASTYLQFGDIEAAKEKYDEASLLSINNIDADLGLIKVAAMQGQTEQSLKQLDQLVEKAESDVDKVKVLTEKENILSLSGRLHEAMEVLEQMRIYSVSYMPPLSQALMYGSKEVAYWANLQEFDTAWDLFNQLKADTKPPFDKMLNLMAQNLHYLQGDNKAAAAAMEAFEQFTEEFQMTVYDQFIYSSNAVIAREKGEYELALEWHDKALRESKQSFVTLNALIVVDELYRQKALTLYSAGRYEDTIEILENTVQRNPLFAQCLVLQGKAMVQIGNYDEARKLVARVEEIWQQADPQFSDLKKLEELKHMLSIKI